MKIGILQTGHAPDELRAANGDYDDMFERLLAGHGFSFQTWDVVDMDLPTSPQQAEGWLITGSRHGAYEDHAFIPHLEQFIRDIYTSGRPLIGICFGHQIIAQALGGKVEKFDGGWSVGPQKYEMDGTEIRALAWHQDQVVELPEDAEVIAHNAFCENAALLYGTKALTVQWHPEFNDAFIDGLIETRGKGVVPDAILATAKAELGTDISRTQQIERLAAFFHQGAEA